MPTIADLRALMTALVLLPGAAVLARGKVLRSASHEIRDRQSSADSSELVRPAIALARDLGNTVADSVYVFDVDSGVTTIDLRPRGPDRYTGGVTVKLGGGMVCVSMFQ